MTEETNTIVTPATASRRAVLTGIAAVPLAAVSFASTAADDPIVAMLRRRNAMIRAYDALPDDDDVMFPACDEVNAFERTIIGTPVLSFMGAALAIDAIRQENCCDDLDQWLMTAANTFFRPHMGAAHA